MGSGRHAVERRERGWWIGQRMPQAVRLLDVGCYTGTDTATWADRAASLVGVDVDPAIFHGHTAVARVQATGSSLPFRSASFDVVTCSEVLEHVPAEIERALIAEMRRVITEDGTLLFTTPHRGWFAWLDPMDAKRRLGLRAGKGHKHYTVEEIHDLFDGLFSIAELDLNSLVLHPLSTWLGAGNRERWQRLRRALSDWDYRHHFGRASFNMALVAHPL
jgi:ubiquinone/menaquinone biosynthesis C-methylase UbiE